LTGVRNDDSTDDTLAAAQGAGAQPRHSRSGSISATARRLR
jgi:hypothetical protein